MTSGQHTHGVSRSEVSALLLGAGRGDRLGQRPKSFLTAGGQSLLERAITQVAEFSDQVIVGLRYEDLDRGHKLIGAKDVTVLAGGETRQATVEALLSKATRPMVLLHETVRSFATPRLFRLVLEAAARYGAATPFLQVSERDAVALRDGSYLNRALPREAVIRTQTPQAVLRELLLAAFGQARIDDWQEESIPALLARAGHRVRLVPGEVENLKITVQEDWELAKVKLAGN